MALEKSTKAARAADRLLFHGHFRSRKAVAAEWGAQSNFRQNAHYKLWY